MADYETDDEGLKNMPFIRKFLQELARIARTAERDAFPGSTGGLHSTGELELPPFEAKDSTSEILTGASGPEPGIAFDNSDALPNIQNVTAFGDQLSPEDPDVYSIPSEPLPQITSAVATSESESVSDFIPMSFQDSGRLESPLPLPQIVIDTRDSSPFVAPFTPDPAPSPLPGFSVPPVDPVVVDSAPGFQLPLIPDVQIAFQATDRLPAVDPILTSVNSGPPAPPLPVIFPNESESGPHFDTVHLNAEDARGRTYDIFEAISNISDVFFDYQRMVLEQIEQLRSKSYDLHAQAQQNFRTTGE